MPCSACHPAPVVGAPARYQAVPMPPYFSRKSGGPEPGLVSRGCAHSQCRVTRTARHRSACFIARLQAHHVQVSVAMHSFARALHIALQGLAALLHERCMSVRLCAHCSGRALLHERCMSLRSCARCSEWRPTQYGTGYCGVVDDQIPRPSPG